MSVPYHESFSLRIVGLSTLVFRLSTALRSWFQKLAQRVAVSLLNPLLGG